MTQTITEQLLPLEAFAGAYKLAGNELFTKCLGAIATGKFEDVIKAESAAYKLQLMSVPYAGEIFFQAESLKVYYRVAQQVGYNRNASDQIKYYKKSLWQTLMWGYGASGFDVADDLIVAASKEVERNKGRALAAMGPDYIDSDNPYLKSRFDVDKTDKEQITDAELLRYKLNAREAVKRHGGSGWWNNFMIGAYRRKLEKIS